MIDLSGWTQTQRWCVFIMINLRASTQRANKLLSDEISQIASGTVAWFVQAVAFEISYRKVILRCVLNMIKLWVQSRLASAWADKMLSWWDIATFTNKMLSHKISQLCPTNKVLLQNYKYKWNQYIDINMFEKNQGGQEHKIMKYLSQQHYSVYKKILISFVDSFSQHLFRLNNWLNSILFFATEIISEKLQHFLFSNDQVEAWRNDSRLNLPNHISEKMQNFLTNIIKKFMTWSLNTLRIR